MAVESCLTEASTPTHTRQVSVGHDWATGAASVPLGHVDEGLLGVREAVLDHAGEGVRSELAAHLLDPFVRLPRRDRRVRPEHQHAVTGVEVGGDLRLLEPALVEVFEQFALALEPCVGRRQPAGDLARRRRDHLVPKAV